MTHGRPRHGKRLAPLDLITVAGPAAPPAKKPALSKLKALVEREGLNPAPDRRRVPLRQQAAAIACHRTAAAGHNQKHKAAPAYRSVYDIPSLPGHQAMDARRPGFGALPRSAFTADKYPQPPPPPPHPEVMQRGDVRPDDDMFLKAAQPQQPAAGSVPAQLGAQRKVIQLSPTAGRKCSGPAWVRKRAGIETGAVDNDEVLAV